MSRITLNSEYEPDQDIIEDFIDEAIYEIKRWKKNENDSIFLDGGFDKNIIDYTLQSYHTTGIEGQLSNSSNGNKVNYQMTPLQYLHSSIPQGVR